MRALITGINGFTGRHLARELENAGMAVHGIGAPGQLDGLHIHACDICERDSVERVIAGIKPDLVFHLAAIAHVQHDDIETMYRTNIIGTRNLLAALALCAPKPAGVLLVSSANVYGNATAGIIDESVPPAPANDYAVSKLAMEHMAALWRGKLPITIARTFNYSGVGQSREFLLPKIVSHFKSRAPILELGNLDVVRDFSDVRTVVQVYRRLLELRTDAGILNVCSGRGYALRDILAMVGELAGYSPEVRVNPAFVRPSEVKSLIGSKLLLEKAVGKVEEIPIRETLKWMLEADS